MGETIGFGQPVPGVAIDADRDGAGMVPGKRYGQVGRPDSFEQERTSLTMVPVTLPLRRNRESECRPDRGESPPDGTELAVALPDVVEERSHELVAGASELTHRRRDVQRVTLIRRRLREEHQGELRSEDSANLDLLGRGERTGAKEAEEAASEVGEVGQPRCDLHSTQRVEVGRASIRAAPMSLPQFSQVP